MQVLTRDGLTREDIITALTASIREIKFKYNLLDKNDNFKKELKVVDACKIDYDSFASIKGNIEMSLKHDSDINYTSDRIQPIISIKIKSKWVDFKQGIYLLNSPSRNDIELIESRDIIGYDKLQILEDDKIEDLYIPYNTNYIEIIKELIKSTGETKIIIPPSDKVMLVDREFEIGTSKLTVINDLLTECGYFSLNVNEDGYFVTELYVLPENRDIDYEYLTDENSVIYNGITEEFDLFDVPNKIIGVVSNPEHDLLVATAENNNASSVTSIPFRGRTITEIVKVNNIANQEELDNYTKRVLSSRNQIYGSIKFKTAIMPIHGFLDTLQVRYDKLNINDRFQETSWSIDFKVDGIMEHECKKVVTI